MFRSVILGILLAVLLLGCSSAPATVVQDRPVTVVVPQTVVVQQTVIVRETVAVPVLQTVVVTASPSSVPTVMPGPTSPMQTPDLPPLEILSHQSYADGDWFHIVGEVRNNSDKPMGSVKIVATLYDSTGKMTGTDFSYAKLDVIPPGGRAPFDTGTDKWAGTANYKLQVQGSQADLPRQDLKILSHASYEDGDWLHVHGEVQNTGATPAESVKLVVTLYDAKGDVVGTDFTYTKLDVIEAGGTSPFETGTDHWPNFDHYDIQVQGR